MILKIVKSVDDSFESEKTGNRQDYYRVYGEKTDGTLIIFGSKKSHDNEIGETIDIMIEGRPDKNGKIRYYEVS